MSEPLPGYCVKARNTSARSENKIHDDATARQLGFRGALVPGVTVYAYLTHPLAVALGSAWLARGTADVKFVKPVFEGEEVTVSGEIGARAATGVTGTVRATTLAGGECAVATFAVPAGQPTPVNPAFYTAAPLPADRPAASRAHLERLGILGTPEAVYDEGAAVTWLSDVTDDLGIYRGPDGWVHPAFYLRQANRALSGNVKLGPWIHVGSRVRHLGGARVGEALATRGRVRSVFEKKGRQFVELDLLIVAGTRARPVGHVLHTAIYELPPPG